MRAVRDVDRRARVRGDDVTDTLATVIRKDPNWAALPQATPPAIRRLLRRCLEKNPRDRIHDIADARLDIEETLAGRDADGAAPAATTTPARRATTAWFVAAVTGVALVAALTFAAAIYDPDQLVAIPTARYGCPARGLARIYRSDGRRRHGPTVGVAGWTADRLHRPEC